MNAAGEAIPPAGQRGRGKSEGIEDPRVPLSFKTQLSAVEISSSYVVS